jgi:hypothetical protein
MPKLTITVDADNGSGISNLLDLALAELKRKSRGLTDFDTNMAGHQAGTIGSYVVQYTIPEVVEDAYDPDDPFGFADVGKPRAPKKVVGYEHPEGWYEDSILLIADPAQPALKEGQLLNYMREVRGQHIYVLLTDQGVATVAREYLRLKPVSESA